MTKVTLIEENDCGYKALYIDGNKISEYRGGSEAELLRDIIEKLLPDVSLDVLNSDDYEWDSVWVDGEGFVEDLSQAVRMDGLE